MISFVLLMFSCAFLCLSAGLWANARQSMRSYAEKTLELVSGFPPLDKVRRTGGADSASGTLDYPRHQGVFTKCAF